MSTALSAPLRVLVVDDEPLARDSVRLALGADPDVVFVTACDEHALRAFEVHALDYLLTPFDDGRLREAVARARRAASGADHAALAERLTALVEQMAGRAGRAYLTRFVVRRGGRAQAVAVSVRSAVHDSTYENLKDNCKD